MLQEGCATNVAVYLLHIIQLLLCSQLLSSSTLRVLVGAISECQKFYFMSQLKFSDASVREKVVALICDSIGV